MLDELVRVTFLLRIVAVVLTLVSLADAAEREPGAVVSLLVGGFVSLAAIRLWPLLASPLRERPVTFTADVALSASLLMAAGPTGPFFMYTLATAMLAGVLFGWARGSYYSVLLCGAYWLGLAMGDVELTFMSVAGMPSMYFVFALGANQVAEGYRRQARDAERLTLTASAEASVRERVRLARELHDSVTKTVLGLSLQASALHSRLAGEASPLTPLAGQLRSSAEQAARESRTALSSLRDSARSLPEMLEAVITEVEQEAGATILRHSLHAAEVESELARFEISRIVIEALRNAVAHSGATRIEVAARSSGSEIEVTVRDDGQGFDARERFEQAVSEGHYGVAGMQERAGEIDGTVEVRSAPGDGTEVIVRVPRPGPVTDDPSTSGGSESTEEVVAA